MAPSSRQLALRALHLYYKVAILSWSCGSVLRVLDLHDKVAIF